MGKKKKKKGKKRKEKESMSEQERPTEPEPTVFGPEVMQRRAEELRAMALQSKGVNLGNHVRIPQAQYAV